MKTFPIEERMKQLSQLMSEAKEGRFSWMLDQVDTTVQQCGVVVALLECIRQRHVEVSQYEQYGEVFLRYVEEE